MIDLHRHLEAAPLIEDLPSHIIKHRIELPADIAELKRALYFQSRPGDLSSFLLPFINHIHKFFISYSAVKDFTILSIKSAHDEGIKYLELRFSPFYMSGLYAGVKQMDPEAIVEAVIEARNEASKIYNIKVGLILIVGRELEISLGHKVIDMAIKFRNQICGVDLAGDEAKYPPNIFIDVFDNAKSHGIPITIHAGETGSADNVRFAIERLGASRIGHGIAAASSEEVIEILKDRGIPLEICPTSNWLTGAIKGDPLNHPLMKLYKAGVKVTLNSDDPLIQGTSLHDELMAVRLLGATDSDLKIFEANSYAAAF